MEWLNYHHLYYFWVVAREGNLTRAAERLHLAPSTVSAQVRTLEDTLDVRLFNREGRGLVLTEQGRMARSYCDEIFGTGRELLAALREGDGRDRTTRLRVGVADIVHRWLVHRVLTMGAKPEVHLVCRSSPPERLVADLAVHALDLVITDSPVGLAADLQVQSQLLGSTPVILVGTAELVESRRDDFPRSLDGAPVLLPAHGTALRRDLETWFDERDLRPLVIAEFEDSGVMKAFGRDGAGLFPIPAAVADEVCNLYGVQILDEFEGLVERVYAITPNRDIHPLVGTIVTDARADLARDDAQ